MHDPAAFAKLVPGFDFLQSLAQSAGAAMPAVGHWIAPTLDPQELDKRIEELRTVQFWLEQNARMLGATIQALEVQRMTLSTLKTMNVSLGDLTESLKIRMPEPAPAAAPSAAAAAAPAPVAAAAKTPVAEAQPAAPVVPSGVIDPMQWWGALTKQFTELAANAIKEGAGSAAGGLGGAPVGKAPPDAGKSSGKPTGAATGTPAKRPRPAAKTAAKAAAGRR